MELGVWLRSLGLERYEAVFRENAIDDQILPNLTSEDLKDLGVAIVGHRRKLLDAIAALRAEASAKALASESVPPGAGGFAKDTAERRQLTIMFCDLVGSTPLSTQYDPEDLREIVGAYHRCVVETVAPFAGFVAKFMGDGVLIYFGYPEAHEDDAERAVRAGIAVIQAIGKLATATPLNVRVGIASGLVVVGDLIGMGAAQERGVVGETANLAARLQTLAQAGTLIIAAGTRRQIGALFELEDLGAQPLAGFAQPQPAYRVLRESGVMSRFEALRGEALTPLVGRDEEIELLLRGWRCATSGKGQVFLVSGEAGIGKSRLVGDLHDRLASEPHIRMRYFCSPHHQDSALYPFISQLERAAGLAHEDTVDAKLDKLEALLVQGSALPEDFVLLAELLSLPAERYPSLGLSSQRKKEKTFEALLRQLETLAAKQPVLFICEDLHWMDASSRDLLKQTIDRAADLPVLVVATHRSEFVPPWDRLPHVTTVSLTRFDPRIGAAMVGLIPGGAGLTHEAAAEIVERADGVPLFVEELTKAVLETGGSGEGFEKTLTGALPSSFAVPSALHAPLMARLDRLGAEAKEVAQIAAAIGREFSQQLLMQISGRGENGLSVALGRLGDAGLVFCRGTPPAATYLFKHALVRDAAYASLLRRRREELHARIAGVLQRDFPDIIEAQPELLAQHFAEAGLADQAAAWWQRAGERAVARSANLEAIAFLKRGLEVLRKLPESADRGQRELMLQTALISPSFATQGWAGAGVEEAATRARELTRQIGVETPAHFGALMGIYFYVQVRGETQRPLEMARDALVFAKRSGDPILLEIAHWLSGNAQWWVANLAMARFYLEEGVASYDATKRDRAETAARHGFDNGTACHAFLGRVLWHLGFADQGLVHAEAAVTAARAARHPYSESWALAWAAALYQLRGEAESCLKSAEAALAIADEQVIPFFAAHGMVLGGWALAKQGRTEEGLRRLRSGIDSYRAIGARIEQIHWLALLAEICRETGRIEEAQSTLRQAFAETEETGIRCFEPELHRLEGELRADPDDEQSEACFHRAVEVARTQGAKSFELRASLSLGRLWFEKGKREEARELLAPVYGWFTEGFDTSDLKEAKALLDRAEMIKPDK